MDGPLAALAAQQCGVFLRHQALAVGYSSNEIDRLVGKEWARVRRGAYIDRELWVALGPEQRYLRKIHAAARQLKEPAVASHVSAAAEHELPLWQLPLNLVHFTRGSLRSGRTEGGVKHHPARVDPYEVVVLDGIEVFDLARTVIDVARTSRYAPAVAVADAALHGGLPMDVLRARFEVMRDWQGARQAGRVISVADGLTESVGETRTRLFLLEMGFADIQPQYEFFVDGRLVGRVDFYLEEENTVVEFDGKIKYKVPDGADPREASEIVFREKRREERIRDLGPEFARIIWDDFTTPRSLAERVRDTTRRGRRRKRLYV